jgi:hypothetical protein
MESHCVILHGGLAMLNRQGMHPITLEFEIGFHDIQFVSGILARNVPGKIQLRQNNPCPQEIWW